MSCKITSYKRSSYKLSIDLIEWIRRSDATARIAVEKSGKKNKTSSKLNKKGSRQSPLVRYGCTMPNQPEMNTQPRGKFHCTNGLQFLDSSASGTTSVTRFGDLLDFGQLFKAFGSN